MAPGTTYDYIIAGTGCAGLSLAMQLKLSGIAFNKVLLIDKDLKNKNDRTWCFWSKAHAYWFESIIHREWTCFAFKSPAFEKKIDLNPYRYCMVRGIDFYSHCISVLKQDARFEYITDEITEIFTENDSAVLNTKTASYKANFIFNSAFRKQDIKPNQVNYVQHFKGWVIEAPEAAFDDTCPVFMDFKTEQHNDCRFVYVIPYSKNKALIEYTGFSKEGIAGEAYDEAIADYIHINLGIKRFTLLETEQGSIPMAQSEFINPYGDRVINIGTAGGASKPSSGYTFYFIQQQCNELIEQLKNKTEHLTLSGRKKRFAFYDKVLLRVLDRKNIPAAEIFTILFQNNAIVDLLDFLNEESSLAEDARILNSLPKKEFLLAALKSR